MKVPQVVKIRQCKYCKLDFNLASNVFSNHVRWCDKRKRDDTNLSLGCLKREEKRLGKLEDFKVICGKEICKKEFLVKERTSQFPLKENYYCSRSCANSGKQDTLEIKERKSALAKLHWLNLSDDEKIKRTTYFTTRSKGEKEVLRQLQELLPHYNWKLSIVRKFKDEFYSLDLVSEKFKIFIEYDGIYHFEDIKGQLNDVQKRDKKTEDYILQTDYRLIRISEDYFHKHGITDLLKELNTEGKIVKLYLR